MSDLISRQDAIAVLSILADKMDSTGKTVMEQTVEVIRDLRSAQKTGKWVTASNTQWYACSECAGAPLWDEYDQEVLSDYCPNCGARMECEEE